MRSSILLAPLIPVAGLDGGPDGGPDGEPVAESIGAMLGPTGAPSVVVGAFTAGDGLRDGY